MPKGKRRGDPKPLCRACRKHRVKHWGNKFCSVACVPLEVRQAGARKGRKLFAYRTRAKAFQSDIARLGRSMTREDLLTVFQQIYRRAYISGYNVGKLNQGHPAAWKAAQERGAA